MNFISTTTKTTTTKLHDYTQSKERDAKKIRAIARTLHVHPLSCRILSSTPCHGRGAARDGGTAVAAVTNADANMLPAEGEEDAAAVVPPGDDGAETWPPLPPAALAVAAEVGPKLKANDGNASASKGPGAPADPGKRRPDRIGDGGMRSRLTHVWVGAAESVHSMNLGVTSQ